jgi:hypothetical protein
MTPNNKNFSPSEWRTATSSAKLTVTGFPSLSWEDDNANLDTRPTPMHERPMQERIDSQLSIIAEHNHVRIALAIEKFWGHPDCVQYMQKLIFDGGHNNGRDRVGFHPDVISALITLVSLHQAE